MLYLFLTIYEIIQSTVNTTAKVPTNIYTIPSTPLIWLIIPVVKIQIPAKAVKMYGVKSNMWFLLLVQSPTTSSTMLIIQANKPIYVKMFSIIHIYYSIHQMLCQPAKNKKEKMILIIL